MLVQVTNSHQIVSESCLAQRPTSAIEPFSQGTRRFFRPANDRQTPVSESKQVLDCPVCARLAISRHRIDVQGIDTAIERHYRNTCLCQALQLVGRLT